MHSEVLDPEFYESDNLHQPHHIELNPVVLSELHAMQWQLRCDEVHM